MTLFIGVFVFFLIHVFTYMDDIIGKGMGAWILVQFFFYSFLTFIPVAMPLAVLLSSIMTFGNLAENYELAAMKSSGLSLFRIMRPVFVFILFLAGFTFVFNNFVLPRITLKSARMLWDIRQAKPTLSIKEGVYYGQLEGYSIKVGKKSKNGQTLYNLNIYDHSEGKGNNIQLYADSGTMKTSADTNYLQIKLNNGTRYEDIMEEEEHRRTRPLMQLMYDELNVNVDMSSFKMRQTEEALFKEHHEMMNVWQIAKELDTINLAIDKKYTNLHNQFTNYFLPRTLKSSSSGKAHIPLKQFYRGLSKEEFKNCIENAQNLVRSSSGYIESIDGEIFSKTITKLDFSIGWHKKINISFACVVLFFVGASLGAIIRKGGMGLPVVVAVMFFLLYYVVSIIFEDLVIQEVYTVAFGTWFPLMLFLPLGIFLTFKAAKDSALFDMSSYVDPIKKLFNRKKSHANPSALQ
ncbi:MAG: permease YjgP/YjgQ family protein [Bacteroidota bacterium]|jgi:lipopolysaccharide export system permease protein|nr:permease YjgP/YjgQ family protein [Bacteroidota bacterium]